jgi:PAS domain S-box-containing protein
MEAIGYLLFFILGFFISRFISKKESCFDTLFIENLSIPVFVKDKNGIYIACNNFFLSLIGKSRDEVIGKDDKSIFDPSSADYLLSKDKEIKQSLTQKFEADISIANRDYAIMFHKNYVKMESFEGIIGVAFDITFRKQLEEALEESQADAIKNYNQLMAILHNSPNITHVRDLNGKFLLVSREFELLLDKSLDLILYKNFEDIFEDKNVIESIKESDKRVLNENTPITYEEEINVNGNIHHYLTTKFGVYNQYNEIYLICTVSIDISDRKDLENKLLMLNKDLEKRVEDGIEALNKNEKLLIQQSKMAAMGEMIGNIAHQWRQPLNIVSSYMMRIENRYYDDNLNDEFIEDISDKINSTLQYMSKTIDDFRNFFKPSKERVEFNILSSIEAIVSITMEQLKNNNIELNITTEDKSIKANSYQNEFKQVIINIVNNSKDAILKNREKGLVQAGRIDISVKEHMGYVVIEICDNGGGIPKEIIDRVFDPYFTTKFEAQGTGLGLYMSKTIIEKNMGGLLTVSNKDNGACFLIKISVNAGENNE